MTIVVVVAICCGSVAAATLREGSLVAAASMNAASWGRTHPT
jgi:hypothetical protein